MITEKQVLDALPRAGFLRAYVSWAGQGLESNLAFHVPAALSLLSQTVPTHLGFPGKPAMRANLFSLVVGPSSSSAKTRTIQAAEEVLRVALPGARMPHPGSPEACLDMLEGRPQIIFFDEFGSLLQGTTAGQLAPLRTILTDIYDCGEVSRAVVDRPGRKPKKPEPNPRLSILGGVTPGFLETFTTETEWTDGFLARFFTVYADAERTTADVLDDEGFNQLVLTLQQYAAHGDAFGVGIQNCTGWEIAAKRAWEEWRGSLRSRAQKGENAIKAAVHRAQGHCLKIAFLLAWDYGAGRSGVPWKIDLDALETAITFTEWHISSVEEIAENLASDRDMKDERKMYRAIDEEPIVYGAALKKAHLTKRRGDEMIASLLEKKMIYRVNDLDPTMPVRYARVRESNVLPFQLRSKDGKVPDSDPFGP